MLLRLESAGPSSPPEPTEVARPGCVKITGRLQRRQVLSKTMLTPSRIYLHLLSWQQDKNKNQILAEPQSGGPADYEKRWNSRRLTELRGLAHVALPERVVLQVAGTQGAVPAEMGHEVSCARADRYGSTLL